MSILPSLGRAVTAALGAAALCACDAPPVPPPPRMVLVAQPQPDAAAQAVYAGEVRARHEPVLAFRIGGKLLRRKVDAGDRIAEGDVMAELDPADLSLRREGDRAQLDAARKLRALARAERDRHAALLARGLIGQSLFDAKQAAADAADAQFDQARASFDESERQVGYAQLRAPASGIVTVAHVSPGQVLAAGQPVFTLAVDGPREIQIAIPEGQVERFEVGDEVSVASWATPDHLMAGRLREIAPAADPVTRTHIARVRVEGDDPPLELGASARVHVAFGGAGELRVPLSAIVGDVGSGTASVWLLDAGTSRLRLAPVKLSTFDERDASIASGLRPGDWLVVAGVHLLHEGEHVAPIDRDHRKVAAVDEG